MLRRNIVIQLNNALSEQEKLRLSTPKETLKAKLTDLVPQPRPLHSSVAPSLLFRRK